MEQIPLMRVSINEQDIQAVSEVLRSGMLVQGSRVELLEVSIAEVTQTQHAIAVSNGTASLHLALLALGVQPGDEVIVPAFSFVATANVVELIGAKPIFVDIELETFNIDVSQIEQAISPKTKAIIPVHEFGLACDISALMQVAEKHSLPVVEDAACALGATHKGKPVGSFGTFGSFSFHPRKAITSGEGGILVTDNKDLADQIRILRNHGSIHRNGQLEFISAGFNYRLTDIQAALLISQLQRFQDQLKHRDQIAQIYNRRLPDSLLQKPSVPADSNHTWQTYHVVLKEGMDRAKFLHYLKEYKILAGLGAQCIPAQPYYQGKYNLDCNKLFPNAMKAFLSGVAIPIYEKLSFEEAEYISDVIINYKS